MRVLAGHLIANCASLLHTKIKDKGTTSGYFGGATHGYNPIEVLQGLIIRWRRDLSIGAP
jgi:hypothetical protein